MHILIISCVFPPEPMVSAMTSSQIAEGLHRRGHQVRLITPFPSRPAGHPYPGYSRRLFKRWRREIGFEGVRCFSFFSSKSELLDRFLENVSFGLTGGWAALTGPRCDVIYSNTWPIFATAVMALVSRVRRIPMVVSIQDVYPESLVSQGRINPKGLMARCMRAVDGIVARHCRTVISISESFEEIYRNGRRVDPARLKVVPNWVNVQPFDVSEDQGLAFRKSKGIPSDAFVITYGGNIGRAAGVETLIQSFWFLKDVTNVYVVIAGEGSHLSGCRALVNEIGCERIVFHTPWPKNETAPVLRAADVLILTTRKTQSLSSLPSKLISYMLAARPVIALTLPESDLAKMISRTGCGWTVMPDQPEELGRKIQEVRMMPANERNHVGQAGRKFAVRNLTEEVCLPKVIRILEDAPLSRI